MAGELGGVLGQDGPGQTHRSGQLGHRRAVHPRRVGQQGGHVGVGELAFEPVVAEHRIAELVVTAASTTWWPHQRQP